MNYGKKKHFYAPAEETAIVQIYLYRAAEFMCSVSSGSHFSGQSQFKMFAANIHCLNMYFPCSYKPFIYQVAQIKV